MINDGIPLSDHILCVTGFAIPSASYIQASTTNYKSEKVKVDILSFEIMDVDVEGGRAFYFNA